MLKNVYLLDFSNRFLLKPTQRFGRLKLPPFSSENYNINKLAHGLTVKLYTEPVPKGKV